MVRSHQHGARVVCVAEAACERPGEVQEWLNRAGERASTLPDIYQALAMLATGGPAALLKAAVERGFVLAAAGYAAKCHLCWQVRRWLFEKGYYPGQLGPAAVYRT